MCIDIIYIYIEVSEIRDVWRNILPRDLGIWFPGIRLSALGSRVGFSGYLGTGHGFARVGCRMLGYRAWAGGFSDRGVSVDGPPNWKSFSHGP